MKWLSAVQIRFTLVCLSIGLVLIAWAWTPSVQAQTEPPTWYEIDENSGVQLHLYFFWSESCPHCRAAHPLIEELPQQYPWLIIHDLELSQNLSHAEQYMELAAAVGQEAQYVPAFIYCGTITTGYDSAQTTGQQLRADLEHCYSQIQAHVQPEAPTAPESAPDDAIAAEGTAPLSAESHVAGGTEANTIVVPGFGALAIEQLSLPVTTALLAGLDAFNPCAFFILMFLLSLMVHAKSRTRMLLIGGVFVLCSGLIYFVFMAAWLNLFLVIGALRWITIVAGIVAVLLALVNIKDYFWFQQGISLSIPEGAKPKLYQRMRTLVNAEQLPTMLAGTILLAIAANSYELLCTAGFPMIYTRMLTLHELPTTSYYLYLAAYNLIYVIPLFLIVLAFAIRFGTRKLREEEGRVLKLLSGLMMLMLGILLIAAPDLLGQVRIALGLLIAAIFITFVMIFLERRGYSLIRKSI